MIGSGLIFNETGACILIQNSKLFKWVENIWENQSVDYHDGYFMEI